MKEILGGKISQNIAQNSGTRNLENFNRYARNIRLGTTCTVRDIELAFNVNWGPALEEKLKKRFEYTRDGEDNFVFTKDNGPQKSGKPRE
ncbi:MAG: hypothetical protein WAV15_00230 [Minisyncoccia bacterium]